jgi:predicted dehydrogenase
VAQAAPPVRFAVWGVDHIHAFSMAGMLAAAGGTFAAWCSDEGPLCDGFAKTFAAVERLDDPRRILEDESIALVACAAVPDRRAGAAARVLEHGKDCLVDKPGVVSLAELQRLRALQLASGRRWVVFFSERFGSAGTVRACELVRQGAIGRPVHVQGSGPHRLGLAPRPDWFFQRARYGGILADLGAHQADQFLVLTGARRARVTSAQVGNFAHPERPDFEDFGEMLLRSESATGFARVDWFTPDGLPSWGDVRLGVVGTEGTLEVRKNVDPAGREGGEHVFLTDREGTRHIGCAGEALPFAGDLLRDVAERSETAVPQAHVFAASELALQAQAAARPLGHLRDARGS